MEFRHRQHAERGLRIQLSVTDPLATRGYAVITSSGPLSVARESSQFGGGVFSQALLSGLRGGADGDADGAVTLEEAYAHVFSQTVRDTARAGDAVQRPEYKRSLSGVGEVVLTRLADRAAGLTFPLELEGNYTVVSVQTGHVVARIDKPVGQTRRLTLPSGRYVVRKVRRSDVLVAELDLAWGGDRWVDDAKMTSVPLGDPLARGAGTFDRPHEITLGPHVASPLIPRAPVLVGYGLGLRLRLVRQGGVLVRFGIGVGSWYQLRRSNSVIAPYVSVLGWSGRSLRRTDLRMGLGARLLSITQQVQLGSVASRLQQWTVGGTAELDWRVPISSMIALSLGAGVDALPLQFDGRLGVRTQGRGRLDVVFRFGGRSRGALGRKER